MAGVLCFEEAEPVELPSTVFALTVGAFDGADGPDLVVLRSSADTIDVLLNDGAGSFRVVDAYEVAPQASLLATRTFGELGCTDVVTGHSDSPDLSYLVCDGDGGLVAFEAESVDAPPVGLVVADVNVDKNLDIVVSQGTDPSKLQVLWGEDSPGFTLGEQTEHAFGSGQLIAASFDVASERPDLFVLDRTAREVSIQTIDFDQKPFSLEFEALGSMAVVDVDDDGLRDVLVTAPINGVIYFARGSDGPSLELDGELEGPSAPSGIVTGDFDGDGNARDLAVTDLSQAGVWIFIHAGTEYRDGQLIELPTTVERLVAGDFDVDGVDDLALTRFTGGADRLYVLRSDP